MFAAFEAWRMLSRLLAPLVVKIPFFSWLPVLPASALPIFIAVWGLAALLFTIGVKTRIAGVVLTIVTAYALLLDQQTYSNHLYLLVLVLLLLTIAHGGVAWAIQLLKIQITLVYFFSAIAKITPQYLAGEVLMLTLKHEGWRTPSIMSALAILSIVVELFIAFGLWSARLRRFAILAGIGFHAAILGILDSSRLSLLIFALDMFAVYVLFVDDELRGQWRWSRFVSSRNGRAT